VGTLADVTAFRDMALHVLDRIETRSRSIDVRDGAQIFAQGDASDAVYAVVGGPGRVRIGAIGRGSKGLMVEIFGTGDIFGEIGVVDGGIRTADAFAEGSVRLLRISASLFMETLAQPLHSVAICAPCSQPGCGARLTCCGTPHSRVSRSGLPGNAVSRQPRRPTLRAWSSVSRSVPAG
jgi:hypothetical protein